MHAHRTRSLAFLPFVVALIVFGASTASAQNIPSSTQPGVVIRSFGEEQRPASRLEDIVTIGKDQSEGKGLSKEKVFTLHKVVLDGSTIYTQADIDALVKDYLEKPVSFADLNEIGHIVTRQYRDDGYIFSSAILSPQKIKGGIVHLKVIEGRITEVKIVGTYTDDNGLIRDMAEKIKAATGPSNTKDLERYLLLLDDLPGITARSLLQPSKTPGGGELIITIEEKKFEGSVSFDNRGSDYLGPYRGTVVGAFNSLFGLHDRTTLRGIMTTDTDEMKFADITHEEQLGTEGFRLKGRMAFTTTRPGEELRALDLNGKSQLYDLEGLYPLVRSRQQNLNLITGFTALNSKTDVLGAQVAEDHVRYVHGGARGDFTDTWDGVNQLELQAYQGLDVLDATHNGLGRSRSNGEQEFLRTDFSATRIQSFGSNFSAQLAASGQYSADNLLASEEFAIGGPEFGRAYDSGEITGDSGVAGSLELRYNDNWANEYITSHQFYVFYDIGKVWNKDVSVGEVPHAMLASAGLGVRFNLIDDMTGYVELDTPLARDVASEHDDDSRIFFSVLKRF